MATPDRAAASHYALNPDPFRKRAAAMLDDENPKVRALAQVVANLSDRYDELRAVFGIEAGQIVRVARCRVNPALPQRGDRDEAEDYLDWFRHQANPKTLAEANTIADALATLLEEAWEFDTDG